MIQDFSRGKLINAIIFFSERTRYCHKIKLFKLLYFLDFQHYQEVGRNVTGLEYFAWPKGPVPSDLDNEIKEGEFVGASDQLLVEFYKGGEYQRVDFVPQVSFESALFSPRELRIMDSLANEFRDCLADKMIESTHLENLPWHQVYEVNGDKLGKIPYELAIKGGESVEVAKMAKERDEFIRNF